MAHKKSKRKKILGIIIAVVIILVGCVAYIIFTRQDVVQDSSDNSRNYERANQQVAELRGSEVTTETVAQYGPYFDEAIGDVTTSDPTDWDQAMIQKALLCIRYAALTGSISQAEAVHTQLQIAEQSGKDIFKGTDLSWDQLNEFAARPVTDSGTTDD